jgi:hypothetical protein
MSSNPGKAAAYAVWFIYLAAVDWATSIPSSQQLTVYPSHSHSAFSLLIRRIRSRNSRSILGRPPTRVDFQRQLAPLSPNLRRSVYPVP